MTSPWRADSPVAAEVLPSPNQGERREDRRPDMLLLHYTGMPRTDEALAWLCDPASSVSCHYFVFEDGRIVQLVPEARRAWHAGAASWGADRDINSCSIGVEIANPGHDGGLPPFPAPQIAAVTALGRDIVSRWSIPPERVLAHSDVAPGRKQDPGERFPWADLYRAGVGHWVQPAPIRDGRALGPGDSGAAGRGRAGPAGAIRLRDRAERPLRRGDGRGRHRLPAPFSSRARRRHRRPVDARHIAGADCSAPVRCWVTKSNEAR